MSVVNRFLGFAIVCSLSLSLTGCPSAEEKTDDTPPPTKESKVQSKETKQKNPLENEETFDDF